MPAEVICDAFNGRRADAYTPVAAKSLGDCQRAGGFDAASMLMGDWSWLIGQGSVGGGGRGWRGEGSGWYASAYGGCTQRAVLCQYDYRLPPAYLYGQKTYISDGTKSLWYANTARIRYVTPDRVVTRGEPAFKTQKQLMGRAVVADSVTKFGALNTVVPGMGYWAHRDGYNVLYGDSHCGWYGDPQQRIIYWPLLDVANGRYFGGSSSVLSDYTNGDLQDAGYNCDSSVGGSVLVWHLLDTAAGVDASVAQ
jgi:hypothetical protein